MNRFSLLALPLALVLAAGPAVAQETQTTPDPGVFIDTVDVNVVNVQVFVTDKAGKAVTGLTVDDFEVLEDKRPIEITNFYAVEDRRPVAEGPSAEDTEDAEDADAPRTTLPRIELPDDQRLYLVIFIDNVNIRPANRRWVMGGLRRFLFEHLTIEDRVMLVSYDRDLHVRQPFTNDPRPILEAIGVVEKVVASAVATDAERRRTLQEIRDSNNVNSAVSSARFHAAYVFNEMSFTIAAMKDLVRDLSGIPGRKALLHVSDGMPLTPGEDLFTAIEQKYGMESRRQQAFDYDLSRRYRELVALANASDVTFYALDSKGLSSGGGLAADEAGTSDLRGSILIESVRYTNLAAPLQIMAESTGGQVILNTNALDTALGRVAEDFSTYYSLGYPAPQQGDGRYHNIEVKLRDKQKGWRIRHREGYRDKKSDVLFTEGSVAALQYGIERNPLGVEVELGTIEPRADGNFLLPLLIKIPIGGITLAPAENVHYGRVRVATGIMDERGDTSPVQSQEPATITVPDAQFEQAQGQHWTYALTLVVNGGRQRVTIGVRDELGSASSFLSLPVNVTG